MLIRWLKRLCTYVPRSFREQRHTVDVCSFKQYERVKISPRIRTVILVAASVLALAVVYFTRSAFIPFLLAVVISYVTMPFVRYLEKHEVPKVPATLIIYLAFIVIFILTVLFIVPRLSAELNGLTDIVPEQARRVRDFVEAVSNRYSRITIPDGIRKVIDDTIQKSEGIVLDFVSRLGNVVLGMFSHLVSLAIAPVLAFYITTDLNLLRESFTQWIPASKRDNVICLLEDIDQVIGEFIRGQLIVCTVIAVLTSIALYLMGVQFAIILGMIAGIVDVIPYFGPFIGMLPCIAVALLQSPKLALYTALAFIAIQQVESNIISPKIVGDRVGLHPVVIIFALLAGERLLGFIGLVLAVPAAAIIKVILHHSWLRITESL
jgi:sporulation integral membrane protein YtvI